MITVRVPGSDYRRLPRPPGIQVPLSSLPEPGKRQFRIAKSLGLDTSFDRVYEFHPCDAKKQNKTNKNK